MFPLIYAGFWDFKGETGHYTVRAIDDAGNVISGYTSQTFFSNLNRPYSITATAPGEIYVALQEVLTGGTSTQSGYKVFHRDGRLKQFVIQKSTPSTILLDSSGNIVVGGEYVDAWNDPIDTNDYNIRKYDSSGALLWSKTVIYNIQPLTANINNLAIDSSDNIYISHSVNNIIAMLDSDGVQQWAKVLSDEPWFASIKDLIIDKSDNQYLYTLGRIKWLTKIDVSDGSTVYQIDPLHDNTSTISICCDDSGNIYLSYSIQYDPTPYLAKFDDSGSLVYDVGITDFVGNLRHDGDYVYGIGRDDGIYKILASDGSDVDYFDIYNQIGANKYYPTCLNVIQTEMPGLYIGLSLGRPTIIGDLTSHIPSLPINLSLASPLIRFDYVGSLAVPSFYFGQIQRTGSALDLQLTSIQCSKSEGGLSLLVICDNFSEALITALGDYSDWELVVFQQLLINSIYQTVPLFTAPVSTYRYDRGNNNASISISASTTTVEQLSQTRLIKGVSYVSMTNGSKRVRSAIDLYVGIGDTADLGNGETFTVGDINYYISASQAVMELGEL